MEKEILKDMYIAYAEQANEWTNKRLTLNTIYIGLCTAIIGVSVTNFKVLGIVLSSVGFVIAILWLLTIHSFKAISSAKFEVIDDLESQLGLKPYEMEWSKSRKKHYLKLTTIEYCTAFIFLVGFIAIFVLSIITMNCESLYDAVRFVK